MLNCPFCGLTNRPYESQCVACGKAIQDPAAAEAKRLEWDALPYKLRAEQEQAFDRMRAGTEGHHLWLKRYRVAHAVVGAVLVGLSMNASVFFVSPWSILIDLAIGAAAGLFLNRLRGGCWYGTGLFVGSAIVSVVLRAPFLNMEGYLQGGWLLTSFAVLFVAASGYIMGLTMDYTHRDHWVTP
jgi:hypothetical protein